MKSMSRREYNTTSVLKLCGALTILESTIIPYYQIKHFGANYMSLFMVGGGGAGSGDYYRGGHAGGGGGGGSVQIFEKIEMYDGQAIGITIGAGGVGGTRNKNGEAGKDTIVTYGTSVYTAKGGYGGYSTNGTYSTGSGIPHSPSNLSPYPRVIGSAYGGQGGGGKELNIISSKYNTPFDLATLTYYYTIKGENGIQNPFDLTDTNYYGAAGGAGYNVNANADYSATYPNLGGQTGGGRGGYGSNNSSTNRGANATFYGGGGGGGAFSSNHTNSLGGNGFQGVVKIYFYK